jgi:hypothetical protein
VLDRAAQSLRLAGLLNCEFYPAALRARKSFVQLREAVLTGSTAAVLMQATDGLGPFVA